jgi:hypothetical protein
MNSLSDYYDNTSNPVIRAIDDFTYLTVGTHYFIASAIILVLLIVVIVLLTGVKEKFNPTSTLRMQKRDGLGESMDGGRDKSFFSTYAQSGGAGYTLAPSTAASGPGSLAYQVLNSSEFDCANRKTNTDDAWSWLNNVANEKMSSRNKPKSDNDFSRVLAGQ